MNAYQPGDIYFCMYPKFVQIPNTTDYNIDSVKIAATPRPIVVLQQVDSQKLIAIPISSDGAQNFLKFPSYLPLLKNDYPSFLKNDSYIKTNQVQLLDVKWLVPQHQPIKVGQLNPLELDRAQLRTLYATQSESAYANWISEIVAKNIKTNPEQVEKEVLENLHMPDRLTIKPSMPFKRGDIYKCHLQPEISNASKERIYGDHNAVVMTDAKFAHISPTQTIVVPILDHKVENISYFSPHDVIFGNQRACVSQIQPMNKDWMENKAASLTMPQMMEMDRAVIATLGLKQQVIDRARSMIQQHRPKGRI